MNKHRTQLGLNSCSRSSLLSTDWQRTCVLPRVVGMECTCYVSGYSLLSARSLKTKWRTDRVFCGLDLLVHKVLGSDEIWY